MKRHLHPSVSIVIPTYNRALSIQRAIQSVFSQTFERYELIVVDDGSTDNTPEVLQPYQTRIRYLRQENAGVSSARNRGIAASEGEWIAFLDSDDEWFPNYLDRQVRCIEKRPDVVAHLTNATTVYRDGKKENHFAGTKLLSQFGTNDKLYLEKPLCHIVQYAPWFVQSSIMRRDKLIASGLFNPDYSIAEDFDLIARMALTGSFCFHREVLVSVNRDDQMFDHLSKKVVVERGKTLAIYDKIINNLAKVQGLDSAERGAIAEFLNANYRARANLLLEEDKRREARILMRDALSIRPDLKSALKYLTLFLPAKVNRFFLPKR